MNKIKRLCAFICIFAALLILGACGSSGSGVKAEMKTTPTRTTMIIDLWFSPNDNLKSGKAIPHIKTYIVEKNEETYKADETVKFENDVYTSTNVEIKSLSPETEYAFYLYVSYNGKDEKICSVKATTNSQGGSVEDAAEIKTAEDFYAMANEPTAHYKLMNDIDFAGEEIPEMFTSSTSKQFTGSFDGNNYTISNFTLKSSSATANVGVFGYTNGAVIQNLKIVGVSVDNSTGKSSSNMGTLIGTAKNTIVKNIEINDVKFNIKGNSASTIMIGGVVGDSDSSDFENVNVSDVEIAFIYARLKVYAGLFAGKLSGNALSNDNIIVNDCSAKGTLTLNAHYPGSEGYLIVGGFIGNLGSIDKVLDSYADATILVTRTVDAAGNDYLLCVGGFIGANHTGSLNVNKCVAFADIEVYAGAKPEESITQAENEEESTKPEDVVMTKKTVNVGGFIGKAYSFFDNITDCAYVKKLVGIKVVAKELNADNETYIYKSETVGVNTDLASKITNLFAATSASELASFSDAIKAYAKEYLK